MAFINVIYPTQEMDQVVFSAPASIETALRMLLAKVNDPRYLASFLAWNLAVAVLEAGSGIATFELSTPQLQHRVWSTITYPLSLQHATGLAFMCRKDQEVVLGSFLGFYGVGVHYNLRGGGGFSFLRSLILFMVASLQTGEVYLSSCLLRRFLCRRWKTVPTIDSKRDAFLFFAITLLVSAVFEAAASVVDSLGRLVSWSDLLIYWLTWWFGVEAGIISVSPFLIHCFAWKFDRNVLRPGKVVEVTLVTVITIGLLVVVYTVTVYTYFKPLPYLLFPMIVYTAFRFNRIGWALVVCLVSMFCSWATIKRKGALYSISGATQVEPRLVIQVELFVSVGAAVAISLASAVREKLHLSRKLEKLNEKLEVLVSERTAELLKTNEDLKIAQVAAEKASQAKSDFLANMSHEIRTPIHGILGMSALVLSSGLTEDQRDNMTTVKDCADLLLHLINGILDVAKIEAGRFEVERVSFRLHHLIKSTMHILQSRAKEKRLRFRWNVHPSVPEVLVGDSGKLRHCLLNLVGNALKFTHRGQVELAVSPLEYHPSARAHSLVPGEVVGVTETRYAFAPQSTVKASQPPSSHDGQQLNLLFQVSDTGIGVSKDKLANIFKPFTQADASVSRIYGGTGLGLCIVQRFVELMGGCLWVESEPGVGSTFYVSLSFDINDGAKEEESSDYEAPSTPASLESLDSFKSSSDGDGVASVRDTFEAVEDSKLSVSKDQVSITITTAPVGSGTPTGDSKPPSPAISPGSRPPPRRVLLVEDNFVNQKVACRLLQKCGHIVTMVGDGVQAVETMQRNHDAFDLVLMDIQMPRMDGLEATQRIREDEVKSGRSRMPIIGLTAHALKGYQETCLQAGMDGYLAKPFDFKQVLSTINSVTSREICIDVTENLD